MTKSNDSFSAIIFSRIPEDFKEYDSILRNMSKFFQASFIGIEESDVGFILSYKEFAGMPGKMMATLWQDKIKNTSEDMSAEIIFLEIDKNLLVNIDKNPLKNIICWKNVIPLYVPEYPDVDCKIKFAGVRDHSHENKDDVWNRFKSYFFNQDKIIDKKIIDGGDL